MTNGVAVNKLSKRRIYLINPKFQLKFSFYAVCIFAICSLPYPLVLNDLFSKFNHYLAEQYPQVKVDFIKQSSDLLLSLAIAQLALMGIILVCYIFFTHRIAGPLYKLQKTFQKVTDGLPLETIQFRKGDYFQELASQYNELVSTLQLQSKKDYDQINDLILLLKNLENNIPDDKKNVLSHAITQLEKMNIKT